MGIYWMQGVRPRRASLVRRLLDWWTGAPTGYQAGQVYGNEFVACQLEP